MHVGRLYPYLDDLWAVSALFWPGFVPRQVVFSLAGPLGTYWSPLIGYEAVSRIGEPSADRDTVTYDFEDLPAGVDTLQVFLAVAYPGGIKSFAAGFFATGSAFASPPGAHGATPSPAYTPYMDVFPDGPPCGGDPYVEPDVLIRPALWSDF